MKTNIIKEIWEIRRAIDEAIVKHDIELFNMAKERFLRVYQTNMHWDSIACMTASRIYDTQEECDFDRESNFAMLAFDLERSRREVLRDNDEELEQIQFSSPLEVLWYTRIMFDLILEGINKNTNTEENILALFDAVQTNIDEILACYDKFIDKTSLKEKITLRLIQKDVSVVYNEFLYKDYIDQE